MSFNKILVADDSLIVRKSVSKFLSESGYSALVAASGEEALQVLRDEEVHCLVLDLHMGSMTGFDVLEKMNAENLTTPVIVLTADLQEGSKTKAKGLGAAAFLTKPFNKQEFIDTLTNVEKSANV